ncbi:MAG TPA: hypothetical protein VK112_05490 [Fodinibius sp.]|nr:hypothetical protein [Fodinibius sp.]
MINEALSKKRREELEMYKMYSQDDDFKKALQHAIKRLVSSQAMQEREHTQEQLNRLSHVRDYLKNQGFNDSDLESLEAI